MTGTDASFSGNGQDRPDVIGEPYIRDTGTLRWIDPRAFRANASSDTIPRPSEWMTWPVSPTEPGGPSGRRWPTPKRRISIGTRSSLPADPDERPEPDDLRHEDQEVVEHEQ